MKKNLVLVVVLGLLGSSVGAAYAAPKNASMGGKTSNADVLKQARAELASAQQAHKMAKTNSKTPKEDLVRLEAVVKAAEEKVNNLK